jgi:hypothetical protein
MFLRPIRGSRDRCTIEGATGADYYRIGAASAAIDNADPAATPADDIDRQRRPQGANRDIGADEFAP